MVKWMIAGFLASAAFASADRGPDPVAFGAGRAGGLSGARLDAAPAPVLAPVKVVDNGLPRDLPGPIGDHPLARLFFGGEDPGTGAAAEGPVREPQSESPAPAR